MPQIIQERLDQVTSLHYGMCLMEAVAYVAGERWSDHPACASPVLAAYGRTLNDTLTHEERQRLLPLVPLLVGTSASQAVEHQRAYLLADAAVRVLAPMALRAANRALQTADIQGHDLEPHAARLTGLGEVRDPRSASAAWDAAASAAKAARDTAKAARDAAVAARGAAGDAAHTPAVDAAIAAFERAIAITE